MISSNPDQPDSCLDMMITNRKEKIASFQAGLPCFSDHTMQVLIRTCKPIQSTKSFMRTRSFKNFNMQQYKINIKNHHKYIETMYEIESEVITKNIQEIVNDSLQEMSPVKTIQTANKSRTQLSEKVRYMMLGRDQAHKKYMETRDPEDHREFKNLRAAINKEISREKFERMTEKFQRDGSSQNEKWKMIKN